MSSELYKSKNYLIDIPFILSNFIREYDIKKANINILYKKGILKLDDYNYLCNAPRLERQKTIGLMQKDQNVLHALEEGIIEAKKLFFEENNIEDSDILSIKNDAIFLLNKIAYITKFDNIEFVHKNTYTSYMKVDRHTEIYYGLNKLDKDSVEIFDVKGINDEILPLHQKYMINFISYILYLLETSSIDDVLNTFNNFYNEYINLKLDIGYYREFNANSLYKIMNKDFALPALDNTQINKKSLDISYNLGIMRDMYGFITTMYFNNTRGGK